MPSSGFTQTYEVGSTKATYVQMTGITTAKTIPKATIGRKIWMQATVQGVRWRPDGTDPTATVGMLIPANETVEYIGNLSDIRVIEATGGAILNIIIFK